MILISIFPGTFANMSEKALFSKKKKNVFKLVPGAGEKGMAVYSEIT